MLKALVLALALANLAFYAWSQGWLDPMVGVRARGDREPERLAQQVRPETVLILAPAAASAAVSLSCLEAGPFSDAELPPVQAALQALAPGGWADIRTEIPGRWIVYVGKNAAREAEGRLEEELTRRGVAFDDIRLGNEAKPGLSLGSFDDRGKAQQALADFNQRGIRGARVVELAPASISHALRVVAADAALTSRLTALKPEMPGRVFAPCAGRSAKP